MREPSIHIKVDKLAELITKHFGISSVEVSSKIKQLSMEARKYAIDKRCINISTQKVEKAVIRRTQSTLGDANLLADIIYSTRVKLKHIGVNKIKQGDQQWAQVKELVPTIKAFCERYQLESRKGYVEFVSLGLRLMSTIKKPNYNFCASWMNQKVDWILSVFDSEKSIKEDEYPEYTLEMCSIYTAEILNRTGIDSNYLKDPQQFANFIKAREVADDIGCDYQIFIEAQFSALEFCNGIPRVEDLHSDKARQRVISYLAKNNMVVEKKPKNNSFDWGKLKK